jgi:hypothetical protein
MTPPASYFIVTVLLAALACGAGVLPPACPNQVPCVTEAVCKSDPARSCAMCRCASPKVAPPVQLAPPQPQP